MAKPIVWLKGEIKTPPFSRMARWKTGFLLRSLQRGERLTMPQSRPMPEIGGPCHELRIHDRNNSWRIIYRIDKDAIILLDVFNKKDAKTPRQVIENCRARLRSYDAS